MAITTITVGRDPETRRLKLVSGKSTMFIGEPKSVPQSVSKDHLSLTIDDNGQITVSNLNPDNVTYVRGKSIMRSTINNDDVIEMGFQRYKITAQSIIQHFVKEKVDISHLEKVWDGFRNEQLAQQKKSQRIVLLRTISSLLTTCAIFCGIVFVDSKNSTRLYLYAVIVIIGLFLTVWSFIHSNAPSKNEQIKERFMDEYSCPKCGLPFGNVAFKYLKKKGKCPHCGVQFK